MGKKCKAEGAHISLRGLGRDSSSGGGGGEMGVSDRVVIRTLGKDAGE